MSLIYNGGVVGRDASTLNRFVEITSTAPAKIFGLFPRKGTIAVGSDADIVIFDPDEEMTISAKTHHMRVDYSCYEGMKVRGVTKTVLSRGEVVIDEGKYVGRAGPRLVPEARTGVLAATESQLLEAAPPLLA